MFVYSVPDAVAKVLEQYKKRKEGEISMLKETQKVEMKTQQDIEKEEADKQASSLQPSAISSDAELQQQEDKKQIPEKLSTNNQQPATDLNDQNDEDDINDKANLSDEASAKSDDHDSHYSSQNHYDMLPECPDCGGDLVYAEGCMMCQGCGYSKCG
jgi:hypothetical protein